MVPITVRELTMEDKNAFLHATQQSQQFHSPWVRAPLTPQEFDEFYRRFQQPNQKSLLVCDALGLIAGIFNISEIVRGLFQNAYLGFYAMANYAGKGYMSAGLKQVLAICFNELTLHRLEANIQPDNNSSIKLVQRNGFRYEGYSPRYLKINGEWRGHEHWAITLEDFIRDNAEVLEKDQVEIVAYQADWPILAESEMQKLKAIFPANLLVDIQHVGSTAVPGLSAKPIIDIQIAVTDLMVTKLLIVPLLQKMGYEFWPENPDPTRLFFVKGMPPYGEKRSHHIHIVEPNSNHWRNKLIFRDYLLAHPETAKQYERLKCELAKEHADDREKYTEAKSQFVNTVLKLAE